MTLGVPIPKLNIIRGVYHITPLAQLAHALKLTPDVIEKAAEQMGLKERKPRKEFLTTRHSLSIRESFFEPEITKQKKIKIKLTDEQKEKIIEMYPHSSNREIAEVAGCKIATLAKFANLHGVVKSEDALKKSLSEAAYKRFEARNSPKSMLIRSLTEASTRVKARDHEGALESIEAAIKFVYGDKNVLRNR